jgi:hypothetical protein
VLGAATKDDNGAAGKATLMAKGLVGAEKHEGVPLGYHITAKGKAALAKITAK